MKVLRAVYAIELLAVGARASASKKTDVLSDAYDCEADPNYSKNTLKGSYELPFAALFRDTRGQKKFEASDVTIVGDKVFSVCDSSWAISNFTRDLKPFSSENRLVGDPDRVPDKDSGYEAIFEHEGLFYVVRESVYHAGDYRAMIEELDLHDDDYTVVRACPSEFVFEGDSEGFEGAVGFPDAEGTLYTLGLCEGNHCSEKKKNDVGNGRVVLMKKNEEDETCLWETVRVVNIPESAAFQDYSAIDITTNGRVAIASQEQSAVWLGHTTGVIDGIIDPEAFEFDDIESSVLQFPRDGGCHTVYCNVEGIHFINDVMIMAVSDKMESGQDFTCQENDQSVHTFVIPYPEKKCAKMNPNPYDFEDEVFPMAPWSTGGAGVWSKSTEEAISGRYSVASPILGDDVVSPRAANVTLELCDDFTGGQISMQLLTTLFPPYDIFRVYLDHHTMVGEYADIDEWTLVSIPVIEPGPHRIDFVYVANPYDTAPGDMPPGEPGKVWLDDVEIQMNPL